MKWPKFAKNLLNSLKVETAIENSFKNYHLEGMNYLCLFKSPELSVRIYEIADTVQVMNQHFKTLVNPHTHLYNFDYILLQGGLDNVKFEYLPLAIQEGVSKRIPKVYSTHNKFAYISKRRDADKAGTYFDSCGHLLVKSTDQLRVQGQGSYVEAHEIHSIRSVGLTTVLMLAYHDLNGNQTEVYCQEEEVPVPEGLNIRFTRPEIINFINRVDFLLATQSTQEESTM